MSASTKRNFRPETNLVHAGTLRSEFGETSEALFLNQSFAYESACSPPTAASPARSRASSTSASATPRRQMFEERLALLEGAEAAARPRPGWRRCTALMGLLRAGDHVVAGRALFGSCRWIISRSGCRGSG